MAENNILLAGFGGQGILFTGKVLAYGGLMEQKNVSWMPSYGPEMRGGTANCGICLSDDEIACPLILHPDIFVAMNLPSFDKYINDVVPGGIAVIDSSLVESKTERTDIRAFYVPATSLAVEHELRKLANMIILGKIIKETGLIKQESIFKALEKVIPPKRQHLLEANQKAIRIGLEC